MSIQCMMRVFYESKAKGNDRLILLAIADEADDEGRNAFPSMRRLAQKANCNKDTVNESIKRLKEMGELEVVPPKKKGPGNHSRYKVLTGLYGESVQLDEEPYGNSVQPKNGTVRTQPDNCTDLAPKLYGPTRTYPTDPSYPRNQSKKLSTEQPIARFPEPRPWCDDCEATGLAKNADGDFTHKPCPTCAASNTRGRHSA